MGGRSPIRPITLIFGPNSAGKSSIIHSIALAHEALRSGELDIHRTEVGGEAIDLGGFRQYVHRRDATQTVEWQVDLDTANLRGRAAEMFAPAKSVAMQFLIGSTEAAGVSLQRCSIAADGEPILTMSARGKDRMRIDRIEEAHPIFRAVLKAVVLLATTSDDVRDEDFAGLDEAVDELIPELTLSVKRMLPRLELPSNPEQDLNNSLLMPVSKGGRKESLRQAVRMFVPRALRDLLAGLADAVEKAVGRLTYLGPLRSYPPRHLAFSVHHDPNWHAGGGFAWDVLRRNAAVREKVNEWLRSPDRLSTPYEVIVRKLVAFDQLDVPLHDAIEAISDDRLDIEYERNEDGEGEGIPFIKDVDREVENAKTIIAESDIDSVPELLLIDKRTNTMVTHRDVGIGISQVLPVLVYAYSLEDRLIAIEQPEIHVHPKLQAELGDVFIEGALGERKCTFLLETHSEHLLLRIMRRMRETATNKLPKGQLPVRPQDVSLLYVEPVGKTAIVREMPLNERGELVKAWPGGFFEEGLREMF